METYDLTKIAEELTATKQKLKETEEAFEAYKKVNPPEVKELEHKEEYRTKTHGKISIHCEVTTNILIPCDFDQYRLNSLGKYAQIVGEIIRNDEYSKLVESQILKHEDITQKHMEAFIHTIKRLIEDGNIEWSNINEVPSVLLLIV